MPNAFLKPTVIVATALGLLQREIVLPRTVWTDAQGNSPLGPNDTFSIRIPGTLAARRRPLRAAVNTAARTIVDDVLTETKVDISLTEDIYSSVGVTDEELTLDINEFGMQVLQPQTRAVAEGLENDLSALMAGAAYATTIVFDPTVTGGMFNGLVDTRRALNDANVPIANRFCVVGSGLEAAFLKDPEFHQADKSGSTDAFNDAVIGVKAGFTIATSNALDADEGYAYHKTAFVMGMRAPVVPQGAAFGQSQSYQGLAMRWLKDYDYRQTQDRSLVDCFAGYNIVTDPVNAAPSFVRAVKMQLKSTSVTMTPATSAVPVGTTRQLQLKDSNGKAVAGGSVAWSTSDATKATVSNTGLVTGVAAGTATITGTYQGSSATCTVTVS